MIAHGDELSDGSGRVVLNLVPAEPLCPVTMAAALRIAKSCNGDIEALFVEDAGIIESLRYPAANGASLAGPSQPAASIARLERDWRLAERITLREIAAAIGGQGPALRDHRVRGEIDSALASVCAEKGPETFIVLGNVVTEPRAAGLDAILASVRSAPGLVIAGRSARRTSGAIVGLIESLDDVSPMQRLISRLRVPEAEAVRYLVVPGPDEPSPWIEAQVSLVLASETDVNATLAPLAPAILSSEASCDDAASVGEIFHRHQAGLAVVRFGGRIVPDGRALRALAEAAGCAVVVSS
ncbi:MAG: hypothetical protein ACT4N2_14005 [Hyphomicrobium sp.]